MATALKYSTLFKKMSGEATKPMARIAIEKFDGYSVLFHGEFGSPGGMSPAGLDIAQASNSTNLWEFGLHYQGAHNRSFISDLKKATGWGVVDEMEVVDFQAAMDAALATPEDESKAVALSRAYFMQGYRYVSKIIKHSTNQMIGKIWLHKGALYGSDGHRMHRQIAMAPETFPTVGFDPVALGAFLRAIDYGNEPWMGAVVDGDKVRLIGGNEHLHCWLTVSQEPDKGEDSDHWKMTSMFGTINDLLDQRDADIIMVQEHSRDMLYNAVKEAPVLDKGAVSIRLTTTDMKFYFDPKMMELPPGEPVKGVRIMAGANLIEFNDTITLSLNQKYLLEALDADRPVMMICLSQRDAVIILNPNQAALVMPMLAETHG